MKKKKPIIILFLYSFTEVKVNKGEYIEAKSGRQAQEVQRSGPGVGSQNMAKTVKFEGVGMTCSGCSGAIERILKKVDGVASISCDIDGKTVTVEYDDAKTKPQEMWDKMKKWADAAQKELAPCPE